jgi:Holliday junction resolvase RusA-like endonuclease
MSRPTLTIVSVNLPLPPSVNDAFAARRGSHLLMKTAAYHAWTRAVRDEFEPGKLTLPTLQYGAYGLWVSLPAKMRGDIDNRVKLLSDMLCVSRKDDFRLAIVKDDDHMDALFVERGGAPPDRVIATVTTLAAWPSYLEMRLL